MGEIWAVILAAGESKRMKVPKMLLKFDGVTMIEKVIRNTVNSEVFNTLVVLGSFRDEISPVIDHLPVIKCVNEDFKEGMLSSVRCGLKMIPGSADAVMIFPGDQPLIDPQVTNSIIEAYRSSGKGIIVPVYNRKRGHPILFDKKYIDIVLGFGKNEVLSSLTQRFRDDLMEVMTDSPGILKDFDTSEDYFIEINQIK